MTKTPLIHFVVAVGVLALAAGGYGLWYATVSSVSAEATSLELQVDEKSRTATRLIAAKAALSSLEADEASLRRYFVSTEDIVPFLSGLERTGRELGAEVEVASVGNDPSSVERKRLVVALKISGSFEAVMRTLGAIEYGPYDSRATSVTLDTPLSPAEGERKQWEATATFVIGTDEPKEPA